LARGTRPLIEPLERRGWGDELLVYARRIAMTEASTVEISKILKEPLNTQM
jgi:hypothetical protein